MTNFPVPDAGREVLYLFDIKLAVMVLSSQDDALVR